MKKSNKYEKNFLDFTPIRLIDWESNHDGIVQLKKPRFNNQFMKKLLKRFGKSEYISIQLDDFGSYVWMNCDGNHKIEDIGYKLRDQFGEKIEPVFERLGTFIKMLAYQKFIAYKDF